MKHVDTGAGGGARVSFSSSVGEGVAAWRGSEPPAAGKKYGVELDLSFVLDKTMCKEPADRTPGLQATRDGTDLRALVEGVDDDNVIYLRLAPDCLFMVETAGGFAEGEAVQILLSPEQLVLVLVGV